ncbi:MAG: hypothetical protein ACKVZ0_08875 [Gemmatimonadales bacterium]
MQRDLVLRWLEQLRLVIARLLRGERDASTELVEIELDRAIEQLLGGSSALVERLDATSAAALLADSTRIFGYAEALALKSALAQARGAAMLAASLARRALDLGREAIRREPLPPKEWTDWIAALERDVPSIPG